MSEGERRFLDRARGVFGKNGKPKEETSPNGQPTVPNAWDAIVHLRRMRARHGLPPSTPTASQPRQGR